MRSLKSFAPWIVYIIFFMGVLFLNPGEHTIHLLTRIVIISLFAISFNLLFGKTGLLSLGNAIFYGLGAYITGMVTKAYSPDYFILFVLLGALGALLLAIPLGILSLRLTEVYFTMLTFAFGQLAWGITIKWYNFTGGDDGIQAIPRPEFLLSTKSYYLFCFVIVTICIYLIWRLYRSPFGLVLSSIRQNPKRVTFLGLNVYRHQFVAYIVSAFFTGISGSLYSGLDGSIHPGMLFWTQSGSIILMTILGGINNFFGPIIGTAIFIVLEDYIGRSTEYWSFFIGAIMLVMVIVFPKGVTGIISSITKIWKIRDKEK